MYYDHTFKFKGTCGGGDSIKILRRMELDKNVFQVGGQARRFSERCILIFLNKSVQLIALSSLYHSYLGAKLGRKKKIGPTCL